MGTVTASEFWDAEAAAFDEQPDHGLRDPTVRAAWADLLRSLPPRSPARIADLGCGTGSVSLQLAEAGHSVLGLDVSPTMIALARQKVAVPGCVAEFSVGDAAAPPWTPRSFDVVLSRHVLLAMDDPGAALTRWIDLLAPEGRLVLIEGRWWTGAGMSAAQVTDLVRRYRLEAEVTTLECEALCGGPIRDERFVVVSRR